MLSPTMDSTNVNPACRRGLKRGIVSLETILGEEGAHGAGLQPLARDPIHLHGDLQQIGLVAFSDRGLDDSHGAGVVRQAVRDTGIDADGKGGWNKTVGVDLVPTVETDGFEFLRQNLRDSLIFAAQFDEGHGRWNGRVENHK